MIIHCMLVRQSLGVEILDLTLQILSNPAAVPAALVQAPTCATNSGSIAPHRITIKQRRLIDEHIARRMHNNNHSLDIVEEPQFITDLKKVVILTFAPSF